MPGRPLNGARYYQEIAPVVALDRAEHLSNTVVTAETPAGTFESCLQVIETTPLEPGASRAKLYARHVGLVVDNVIQRVDYRRKINDRHDGCDDDEDDDQDDDD